MSETIQVCAVGGPGDGRRYAIDTKSDIRHKISIRVFADGPMRGNIVAPNIHLPPAMFVDYDLAEFGMQGDESVFILKPCGSTLVQVMNLLVGGYAGFGNGIMASVALAHAVTLLRDVVKLVEPYDACDVYHEDHETKARVKQFFEAYDAKERGN